MKTKLLTYGKTFLILIVSYFVVNAITAGIFVADTPNLRKDLPTYLAAVGQSIISTPGYFFSGKLPSTSKASPAQLDLAQKAIESATKQTAKGVFAAEIENKPVTVVKKGQVSWVIHTYTVKGKTIEIKIPAGQEAPTQQTVEQAY